MENAVAFFSYIFITAFTPGPNNLMAMTNAGRYGLARSLRFCMGVFAGFLIVMGTCAVSGTLLLRTAPAAGPYMKAVGCAYLLYLAWITISDDGTAEDGTGTAASSFRSGMFLQLINVKVILYGITALSSFVLPRYGAPHQLSAFVLILSLVGFAGTFAWALLGSVFRGFLARRRRVANTVMALLLLYCALSIALS